MFDDKDKNIKNLRCSLDAAGVCSGDDKAPSRFKCPLGIFKKFVLFKQSDQLSVEHLKAVLKSVFLAFVWCTSNIR